MSSNAAINVRDILFDKTLVVGQTWAAVLSFSFIWQRTQTYRAYLPQINTKICECLCVCEFTNTRSPVRHTSIHSRLPTKRVSIHRKLRMHCAHALKYALGGAMTVAGWFKQIAAHYTTPSNKYKSRIIRHCFYQLEDIVYIIFRDCRLCLKTCFLQSDKNWMDHGFAIALILFH